MPDNHSDIEDHETLSSDGDPRSIGSSPSGLVFKTHPGERSSPPSALSVQGSSPTEISPNSLSSVQAALAALKAGQMSLNQVKTKLIGLGQFLSVLQREERK